MNDIKKLLAIMYKKAAGYKTKEVTEEYSADGEGFMHLTKKKTVTKSVPPDLTAVKFLIEGNYGDRDYTTMTDKELSAEKSRLLAILAEKTDKENQI